MALFSSRERIAVWVIALVIAAGWMVRLSGRLRDAPAEPVLIHDAVPVPAELAATADDLSAPVDLNTATVADLETLPMIGPVRAEAIVAWRGEHGPFVTIDDLLQVSGIGPATLDRIRDRVTVGRE